jgi:glycosyltransferase involved in cell wall biosynthesis
MKLAGFTYVRNGFDYGVPFLESIQSVLPICSEFIVAVGDSTDGTREAIVQLNNPKIKIIDTVWDMQLKEGGKVFAQQANIALDHVQADWCLHIQSDEVFHEKELDNIVAQIDAHDADKKVDGFILPFIHFWGGYDHIRNTRRVHNFEIRIFRNHIGVRSYRDSQGFTKYQSFEAYENGTEKGEKLHVKKLDATVYHYTGIRSPDAYAKKVAMFQSYYNTAEGLKKIMASHNYQMHSVDRTIPFQGEHPAIMHAKVAAQDWEYSYKKDLSVWHKKDKFLQPIEDFLGFKFGEYKNYHLIK